MYKKISKASVKGGSKETQFNIGDGFRDVWNRPPIVGSDSRRRRQMRLINKFRVEKVNKTISKASPMANQWEKSSKLAEQMRRSLTQQNILSIMELQSEEEQPRKEPESAKRKLLSAEYDRIYQVFQYLEDLLFKMIPNQTSVSYLSQKKYLRDLHFEISDVFKILKMDPDLYRAAWRYSDKSRDFDLILKQRRVYTNPS